MKTRQVLPGLLLSLLVVATPWIALGNSTHSVIAATAGSAFTLKSDGTVWAWGRNSYGELGDGTVTNHYTPAQISGLTGVMALETEGGSEIVAVKSDRTVWAWGSNYSYGIGDGTTTNHFTPVQISGLTGITAVESSSWGHTVALKSDGTVWAWGNNEAGQLGNGTTNNSSIPVQVSGLTSVIAVEPAYYRTVALKSDGTVWAWGGNSSGQSGDGTTTNHFTPVQVSGLTGVTAVSAGDLYTLALKSDGTVWAWGYNDNGDLGDGTTTNHFTPVQVSGLTSVTTVAANYRSPVALKADGTVWAWGDNSSGRLGDGTSTNHYTPCKVSGLTGVIAVGGATVALKADGTVWAWGDNTYGQLGDGTTTNHYTPVQVSGLTNVIAVADDYLGRLALKSDGTVWAWGANFWGQLGDGTTNNSSIPVQVSGLSGVWTNWLTIIFTNRVPMTVEIAPLSPPPVATQLKLFVGGELRSTTDYPLNPAHKTIVLTHGWNSSPEGWATGMAALIETRIGVGNANIVVWDWHGDAATSCLWKIPNFKAAADRTPDQGVALGQALFAQLGADYSQPIHFIGHSMGTLLNAYAADYLDGPIVKGAGAWPYSNVHVTLFDEAEVGSDAGCMRVLSDAFTAQCEVPKLTNHKPLPRRFAWADNYITAFGQLQANAVNVILTNRFPNATGVFDLAAKLEAYHGYPMEWYSNTVVNPGGSQFGFGKSFEDGGIPPFPATPTYFIQNGNGLDEKIEFFADDWLGVRCSKYYEFMRPTESMYVTTPALPARMSVNKWQPTFQFSDNSTVYIFKPGTTAQQPQQSFGAMSAVNTTDTTNATGAAWIPLDVPTNAVTMSFDFMLEGDGEQDRFAVGVNGTNVSSMAVSQIATGVFVNTGAIDVSAFAGQTVELFLGIIGNTSTNVTLSVKNFNFYSPLPPTAGFNATPYIGMTPLLVNFADSSTGVITNWFWNFGDGITTNLPVGDVSHTYLTPGIYSSSLVVSGPAGSSSNIWTNMIVVAPLDSIGDGIPNSWRAQFFPAVDPTGASTNYQTCATCDADGTGQNNLFKYLAGLDPTNSASVFRITSVQQQGNNLNISWKTAGGKTNVLQAATGIGGTYTNVSPNIIITGSGDTTTNYFDVGGATNVPARFYKVRLVP